MIRKYLKEDIHLQKKKQETIEIIGYQKIMKVSKNSQRNNPETVTNENDKEIPKERCTSPEERQKNY